MEAQVKRPDFNGLKRVIAALDSINERLGRITSWFTTLLVAVVFCDVVMRYLFNTSYVFMQELEWHVFAMAFLFGAGYTLKRDSHVRVDIFYQGASEKKKAWINLLGTVFLLIPGCLMIILASLPWVWESVKILEHSRDPGGIPLRFIIKSCLPLGFLFLLLQGFSVVLSCIATIFGDDSAEEQ
ncbi:MAG: TRAP transporter small permease subunit [Desulfarculaceae bacterium]|nr:TRAP transporter small permease subunit [Desulfarculaceae bacterium]MCF8071114.1 TRAP transporter small permease subunit [Desulfarculaceae bacterium]MCF8101283.1 TRAP transporter small permease subunit [Desulfarculaceae bacterium]MCF8115168.1 TRAP transporter small permease subunit [Desulfarculaceae bacterium]